MSIEKMNPEEEQMAPDRVEDLHLAREMADIENHTRELDRNMPGLGFKEMGEKDADAHRAAMENPTAAKTASLNAVFEKHPNLLEDYRRRLAKGDREIDNVLSELDTKLHLKGSNNKMELGRIIHTAKDFKAEFIAFLAERMK